MDVKLSTPLRIGLGCFGLTLILLGVVVALGSAFMPRMRAWAASNGIGDEKEISTLVDGQMVDEQGCFVVVVQEGDEQDQIPHPTHYGSTLIQKTKCWNLTFTGDHVLVVGGFSVNGVGDGVYRGVAGPQSNLRVTVTDGFVSLVEDEWGQTEWCFRLGEAIARGWAHSVEEPLSGWTCEGLPSQAPTQSGAATPVPGTGGGGDTTTGTVNGKPRRDLSSGGEDINGDGKAEELRFEAGEAVAGEVIVLSDGRSCGGGKQFLANAATDGYVVAGTVNPWTAEVEGFQACSPLP